MAQYEYMDNQKIKSNYERWQKFLQRDERKKFEDKCGDLFSAYLNELGKRGWEISVGGGAYGIYLAKREISNEPKPGLHQEPSLKERQRESFFR